MTVLGCAGGVTRILLNESLWAVHRSRESCFFVCCSLRGGGGSQVAGALNACVFGGCYSMSGSIRMCWRELTFLNTK